MVNHRNHSRAQQAGSDFDQVIETLLANGQPSIESKTRVNVLGESADSPSIRKLQKRIKSSDHVPRLFENRDSSGRISSPNHVYAKWQGAHWIMAILADIGYPIEDRRLAPIRDQLQTHWLGRNFYDEFVVESKSRVYGKPGVPFIQGRHRRYASQQSNALWSVLQLGLVNQKTHDLAERLLRWQWPDGGWNCDKDPSAHHSSYMESILPLRALSLYARNFGHNPARDAAVRASEIFLKRHLYRRQRDSKVMRAEFIQLHYPIYWHYDILHGLKVLAESGFVNDPRCADAIALLESKETDDGGWPAEKKYYKTSGSIKQGNDMVDWGGTSTKTMNPWVTVDVLFVLKAAGRLS